MTTRRFNEFFCSSYNFLHLNKTFDCYFGSMETEHAREFAKIFLDEKEFIITDFDDENVEVIFKHNYQIFNKIISPDPQKILKFLDNGLMEFNESLFEYKINPNESSFDKTSSFNISNRAVSNNQCFDITDIFSSSKNPEYSGIPHYFGSVDRKIICEFADKFLHETEYILIDSDTNANELLILSCGFGDSGIMTILKTDFGYACGNLEDNSILNILLKVEKKFKVEPFERFQLFA